MNLDSPDAHVQLLCTYLTENIADIKGIYGFGSRFNGRARPDSDWDIALLCGGLLDEVLLYEHAAQLTELLCADAIDLIDLRRAPTVLRFEVITTGQRIYTTDAFLCDMYECGSCTEFQFFYEQTEELTKAWVEAYLKKDFSASKNLPPTLPF